MNGMSAGSPATFHAPPVPAKFFVGIGVDNASAIRSTAF